MLVLILKFPGEEEEKELPMVLVAIGDITKDNASEVIAAGADSVAVIGAILGAASPEDAAQQIADIFEAQT